MTVGKAFLFINTIMTEIPSDNILTDSDDYFARRLPGQPCTIEVCGVFGGATVKPGYISQDATPAFIADVDDSNAEKPKTAAGRWETIAPANGKVAVNVSGATGTTAIIITITNTYK